MSLHVSIEEHAAGLVLSGQQFKGTLHVTTPSVLTFTAVSILLRGTSKTKFTRTKIEVGAHHGKIGIKPKKGRNVRATHCAAELSFPRCPLPGFEMPSSPLSHFDITHAAVCEFRLSTSLQYLRRCSCCSNAAHRNSRRSRHHLLPILLLIKSIASCWSTNFFCFLSSVAENSR